MTGGAAVPDPTPSRAAGPARQPRRPGPFAGLAQRSTQAELMDDPAFGDAALHARVLADLAAVNRLTRTHAPLLQFLRGAWRALPPHTPLTVLDVGCGHGDLLRALRRAATRDGRAPGTLRLVGLDLQPHAVAAARAATPAAAAVEFVAGSVFDLERHTAPTAVRPDFVVSSQLAHHLDDDALAALLHWLQRHARRGWCVADLRRAWLPWAGFRLLARAARWHPVVRIDGTRSIARSRTPAEWRALLARAGLAAEVRRHAPFRLTVRHLRAGAP